MKFLLSANHPVISSHSSRVTLLVSRYEAALGTQQLVRADLWVAERPFGSSTRTLGINSLSHSEYIFSLAILVAFFFGGLFTIIWGIGRLKLIRRLETFKKTTGVVLTSRPEGTGAREFRPAVQYKFTADGNEYISDRLTAFWTDKRFSYSLSSAARDISNEMDQYAPDSSIVVWHDPTNPAFSVLDCRVSSNAIVGCRIYVILGAVMALASGVLITALLSSQP